MQCLLSCSHCQSQYSGCPHALSASFNEVAALMLYSASFNTVATPMFLVPVLMLWLLSCSQCQSIYSGCSHALKASLALHCQFQYSGCSHVLSASLSILAALMLSVPVFIQWLLSYSQCQSLYSGCSQALSTSLKTVAALTKKYYKLQITKYHKIIYFYLFINRLFQIKCGSVTRSIFVKASINNNLKF